MSTADDARPVVPDGYHAEVRRHSFLASTLRPARTAEEARVLAEARAAADSGPVRTRDHVPRRRTRQPDHDDPDGPLPDA
jgi:hypothetical protein